ncbi:MAG TPA: alkaline phosphatase family protein [Candidatus Thermoplasmatota archaeon]|nr:alkaline phosphatase family protein [Candidatus Thermoplasmatota archaeon]
MTTTPPPTTLLLILDACRRDYLTPENAPFLSGLLKTGVSASIESPPGFTQRTTMFTGTYPDTSGNFQAFGYNPEASPFRWLRKLGPLNSLYQPRKVMFPARLAVKKVTQWVSGHYHTDPAWIPATYLPNFEVVEDGKPIFEPGALPLTSIFDLCRDAGKSFKYLAHPISGNDDEIFQMLLDTYNNKEPHSLVFAQFSNLDERGHHHGPLVPEGRRPARNQKPADVEVMKREIREVDRKCEAIYNAMKANYPQFAFLAIGDHGMAPVQEKVNILKELKQLPLKAGKDYVVFVNSTIAEFWFQNDRARDLITNLLDQAPYGRIMREAERREHRVWWTHRRYGDLLFAANVGVLFWPDYFHVVEHDIKGMHGYIDKPEETTGVLASGGTLVQGPLELGNRNLVDVFPTLCNLVGVPTPPTNEGKSLIPQTVVHAP